MLLLVLLWASDASARDVLGVPLPSGASEVSPNRFKSPLDHGATVKWLKRELKRLGYPAEAQTMIELPDVLSAHLASPSASTRWTGVNVSEYAGGVWIFIIERD